MDPKPALTPEEWEEKFREALEALGEDSRNPDIVARVAQAAEGLGRTPEAFMYYDKLVQIDPGNVWAAQRLQAMATTPEQQKRAEQVRSQPRTFGSALGGVLAYPFQGAGLGMLIIGSIMFFAISFVLRKNVFFIYSIGPAALMSMYILAFYASVFTSSTMGNEEVPGWPDVTNWSSLMGDAFQIVAAFIISFLPIILALFLLVAGLLSVLFSGNTAPTPM